MVGLSALFLGWGFGFAFFKPIDFAGNFIRAYVGLLVISVISLLVLMTLSNRSVEQNQRDLISYAHLTAVALLETVCPLRANLTCNTLQEALDHSHSFLDLAVSFTSNVSRSLTPVFIGSEEQLEAESLPAVLQLSHSFAIRIIRRLTSLVDHSFKLAFCALWDENCLANTSAKP